MENVKIGKFDKLKKLLREKSFEKIEKLKFSGIVVIFPKLTYNTSLVSNLQVPSPSGAGGGAILLLDPLRFSYNLTWRSLLNT